MKVRICYTVEVDDHFLRAVNHWFGEEGMASREDIKRWFRQFGESNSAEGRIGYCDDCLDAGYGDEEGSGNPLTADTHEA